jgi:hypothetical protein
MPSVSGWGLRLEQMAGDAARASSEFLCPRYRAGDCDPSTRASPSLSCSCFYALGIGLGFATLGGSNDATNLWPFLCPRYRAGAATNVHPVILKLYEFLCPRHRAGVCDHLPLPDRGDQRDVSMPSVSGWGLRQMPTGGTFDLRLCEALRRPLHKPTSKPGQIGPVREGKPVTCVFSRTNRAGRGRFRAPLYRVT